CLCIFDFSFACGASSVDVQGLRIYWAVTAVEALAVAWSGLARLAPTFPNVGAERFQVAQFQDPGWLSGDRLALQPLDDRGGLALNDKAYRSLPGEPGGDDLRSGFACVDQADDVVGVDVHLTSAASGYLKCNELHGPVPKVHGEGEGTLRPQGFPIVPRARKCPQDNPRALRLATL